MKRVLYGNEADMRKWLNESMGSLRELRDKLDESSIFNRGFHAEIAIVVYSKDPGGLVKSFYKLSDPDGFMQPVVSINRPR